MSSTLPLVRCECAALGDTTPPKIKLSESVSVAASSFGKCLDSVAFFNGIELPKDARSLVLLGILLCLLRFELDWNVVVTSLRKGRRIGMHCTIIVPHISEENLS